YRRLNDTARPHLLREEFTLSAPRFIFLPKPCISRKKFHNSTCGEVPKTAIRSVLYRAIGPAYPPADGSPSSEKIHQTCLYQKLSIPTPGYIPSFKSDLGFLDIGKSVT